MATITLKYDVRNRQAAKLIEYIRSLRFVKVKEKKAKIKEEKFNLYESLDRAFADVKLMMDGKKKEKTLDEFLEEIRCEKQQEEENATQRPLKTVCKKNELQHNND